MNRKRLEFAFEILQPANWERFERFASEFLATEFENLRTTASPSGDGGRDSELFSPEDDSSVVLQYSISDSWTGKIKATAERLKTTKPNASILIYATNRLIGAKADSVREALRTDFGLFLDIRDRNWFCERFKLNSAREVIAEEFAAEIVDPYLASKDIVTSKGTAIDSLEARAAFVFLGLQWEDKNREKGLTKLSFEALVRAVLRDSSPEKRMPRHSVIEGVQDILPSHSKDRIELLTISALERLTKRAVRHYEAPDEFCLTHDEAAKLRDRLAAAESDDRELGNEICEVVISCASSQDWDVETHVSAICQRVRRVVERFLFSRGELFVSALTSGHFEHLELGGLRDIVIADFAKDTDTHSLGGAAAEIVIDSSLEIILSPTEIVHRHLRRLADSSRVIHGEDTESADARVGDWCGLVARRWVFEEAGAACGSRSLARICAIAGIAVECG